MVNHPIPNGPPNGPPNIRPEGPPPPMMMGGDQGGGDWYGYNQPHGGGRGYPPNYGGGNGEHFRGGPPRGRGGPRGRGRGQFQRFRNENGERKFMHYIACYMYIHVLMNEYMKVFLFVSNLAHVAD